MSNTLPNNLGITSSGQLVITRKNKHFAVSRNFMDVGLIADALNIPILPSVGLASVNIPKIPYEQWKQTVGFHRWGQKTFGKETHISHFITRDGNLITFPFHQEVEGMTIKIDLTTPENQALLEEMEREHGIDVGAFHGTTHHHCTTSAYQSSTDKGDEENQQGMHFTLGNMNLPQMTIHCRISAIFNGDPSLIVEGQPVPDGAKIAKSMVDMTGANLLNLFDIPEMDKNIHAMPKEYIDFAIKYYLTSLDNQPFPEEWKARVTQKKYAPSYVPQHPAWGKQQYGGGVGHMGNMAKMGSKGLLKKEENSKIYSPYSKKGFSNTESELRIGLNTELNKISHIFSGLILSKAVDLKSFIEYVLIDSIIPVEEFFKQATEADKTKIEKFVKDHKGLSNVYATLSDFIELDPKAWEDAWKITLNKLTAGKSPGSNVWALACNLVEKANKRTVELVNV
jgi:hypothetical protein